MLTVKASTMTSTLLENPQLPTGTAELSEPARLEMNVTTDIRPKVTYDELLKLCALNRDLNFEWDPDGTLYIMSPAAGGSSRRNSDIAYQLEAWRRSLGSGIAFDSSGGFIFPDGKLRNADAAWVRQDRWDALTVEQRENGFPPLAPDFVVELRSPSDKRRDIQAKMRIYMENGVRLAWLIDPIAGEVEIHREGKPAEVLKRPETLSGEDVLPGFVLHLQQIL